ncbi:MCM2/3/5 family protein [archaeon BMS3Bbin15]|nr:MCM2/3/5 family protein [archaeon BMS3Bbin15]
MLAEESRLTGKELQKKFEKFFRSYYTIDILDIIRHYPAKQSLEVDMEVLEKYDYVLAETLLYNPDEALNAAHRAMAAIDLPVVGEVKVKVNVRFINLPDTANVLIRELRSSDIGRFIGIDGIVRKATDVRPKLITGAFECQQCNHINYVEQKDDVLREPYICESCERKSTYKLIVEDSVFRDSQKILVQESLEDLRGGESPKQIPIYLEDDLAGKITPGETVFVSGILRTAVKRNRTVKLRVFEIFLEANNFKPIQIEFEEIEIKKEDVEKILEFSKSSDVYEKIIASIAPHIFGYSKIKEAIMYQLFSAPQINLPDGGKVRGDSHIILMGEPATGKSELLQYVAKELAPRGIYASGRGTSGAGLTAAAVKDEFGDGGWSLEAGALVLADKGIACIDEFDKMETNDRSAMHEAMEQQSVSIAKAGILATFRSRCSILAAANPKYGRFDDYKALSEQVNLPPSILSRFDLIFFVRDDPSTTRDVARHILDTAVSPESVIPPLSPEFLRKHIAYAKQNVFPELSPEAREVIENFYVQMREKAQQAEDMPIPLTARQLWAIVRLSKARARVRLSNIVTADDAETAIGLVKASLAQAGIDMETGEIDIDKIYSGITKSQRDKINDILSIIRELENEYGTAKKSEIIEIGERKGISKTNTMEVLDKLKAKGDIFEPKFERYKVT